MINNLFRVSSPKIIDVQRVYAYVPERADEPVWPLPVTINCPDSILHAFQQLLSGTKLLGCRFENPYTGAWVTLPSRASELTGQHLQMLARNEAINVDGQMNTALYRGLLTDNQVACLRCLVKATNVAGVVCPTHQGGYRRTRLPLPPSHVILIDQAGFQWQDDFRNTGGLLFYPDNPNDVDLPAGYADWQATLFAVLFKTPRPRAPSDWVLPVRWNGVEGQLDLTLVQLAIAMEFSQALDAVVDQGNTNLAANVRINFKFLRAGMGFFAGGLSGDLHALRVARLCGIEQVLSHIAAQPMAARAARLGKIARITLPHSEDGPYTDAVLARIEDLVGRSLGLLWGGAPEEDPFRPHAHYVTATTNCADPHAMIGNEGGHSSVDASISCNANVNGLNAYCNPNMRLRTSLIDLDWFVQERLVSSPEFRV